MSRKRRISFESVEGLQTGRFNLGLNTSAVSYRLGATLIDTGCSHCWPAVREFVRERPVERILLTHHHEDHSGNAARIQRETGGAVYAHSEALLPLEKGWPLAPYQRLVWGRPAPVRAEALPDKIEREEGLLFVISAPGHAGDQVCFLEPERGWLFTGDLFISRRPRFLRFDEQIRKQMASLRKMLEWDFQVVFCAHRGIVRQGRQAIRDKLDYLEEICGKAAELHESGLSVSRIARELLGRETLTSMATGFHFSKKNLIRSCLQAEKE